MNTEAEVLLRGGACLSEADTVRSMLTHALQQQGRSYLVITILDMHDHCKALIIYHRQAGGKFTSCHVAEGLVVLNWLPCSLEAPCRKTYWGLP